MKIQPSIYILKTRFVFALEHVKISNIFVGTSRMIKSPTGTAHIFEIVKSEETDQYELAARSFCGVERSKIGELTGDADKNPGLDLCKGCEQAYKDRPDSPWSLFSQGIAPKREDADV